MSSPGQVSQRPSPDLPYAHPPSYPPSVPIPSFTPRLTQEPSHLATSESFSSPSVGVKRSKSFKDKQWESAFGPLSISTFLRKDWIKYYIILILLLVAVAIITIFHHQIIVALKPFADDLHDLKVKGVNIGWIIPIIILFIISFPPLFGHEIVIILCGLVWGLWIGFAIVSVGTFLGEIANYWTFKYACTNRAQKLERKDLNYACMCIVVRDGGFWIAFLARLSAIPGHLVTPVFATTGMTLWIFSTATLLSMPKQLAGVYLGTLFNIETDTKSTSSKVIEYTVLIISFFVTVLAALFIYRRMAKVRPLVQQRWEAERAAGADVDHHIEPYQYGSARAVLQSPSAGSSLSSFYHQDSLHPPLFEKDPDVLRPGSQTLTSVSSHHHDTPIHHTFTTKFPVSVHVNNPHQSRG